MARCSVFTEGRTASQSVSQSVCGECFRALAPWQPPDSSTNTERTLRAEGHVSAGSRRPRKEAAARMAVRPARGSRGPLAGSPGPAQRRPHTRSRREQAPWTLDVSLGFPRAPPRGRRAGPVEDLLEQKLGREWSGPGMGANRCEQRRGRRVAVSGSLGSSLPAIFPPCSCRLWDLPRLSAPSLVSRAQDPTGLGSAVPTPAGSRGAER